MSTTWQTITANHDLAFRAPLRARSTLIGWTGFGGHDGGRIATLRNADLGRHSIEHLLREAGYNVFTLSGTRNCTVVLKRRETPEKFVEAMREIVAKRVESFEVGTFDYGTNLNRTHHYPDGPLPV